MANKANWTLIVKFVVTVWETTYKPGKYTLSGKAYTELKAAPYVTEASKEEIQERKDYQKKVAAARKAKGVKTDKVVEDDEDEDEDEDDTTGDDTTGANETSDFTEEELRALPEADLRVLYTAEQTKLGKPTPPNIGVEKIISNLIK